MQTLAVSPVFFYIFAALAIACSLLVILKRNPVASALALVMVFFSFGGIYALLQAHLVAALQILVYTGAIMVLFVFVIMLLNAQPARFEFTKSILPQQILVGVACAALLAGVIRVLRHMPIPETVGPYTPANIAASGGNTRVLSELLFSEYILPFELTSVLLLAAMVCVVAIAMRKGPSKSTLRGPSVAKTMGVRFGSGAAAADRVPDTGGVTGGVK